MIKININEIKELLKTIDSTNLEYVKLETEELKLEVSKQSKSIEKTSITNIGDNVSYLEAITDEIYEEDVTDSNINTDETLFFVEAPLMGTFYSAANPESNDFVKIGDKVENGDTLCILEAMKLMNEITSDINGEIVEILAKNEDLVEYNQPLFKIKPL